MQAQFLQFISQNKLLTRSNKIILTVSGGIDSIVLFDLFLTCNFSFVVAHCNFGLRGKESDEDENFVKKFCKKNKIAFYSTRFNTNSIAEEKHISTQMAARELRYVYFEKLRKKLGFDFIATAHHQTDVVETMLINLLRGTGIAGLHGISVKKEKIIRPLLFATRNEIETYCIAAKLVYREDSSNRSDAYLRNKIRHNVLPEFEKIKPGYEKSFADSANRILHAEKVFMTAIAQERKKIEEKSKSEIRYSISKLKKLKPLSIYLYEFFKPYDFSAALCAEIETCIGEGPGKQFYSVSHRLLLDRKFIYITKLVIQPKKASYKIEQSTQSITHPFRMQVHQIANTVGFKLSSQKSCAQVDASALRFPLQLRKWKKGDVFYPLGMKGSKKLSDFFIDSKLSIFEKEKIWLLCSDKKIVWIINYRIDNRFKVTLATKSILQFTYFEN